MNGYSIEFAAHRRTFRPLWRICGPVAALASASWLGGCAQVNAEFQPPPINPSSPVAAYAQKVSDEILPMPTFQQVPPKVNDVRPAAIYKTAVVDEVRHRRALEAWAAANPQVTPDSEGWASLQRQRISDFQAKPVDLAHDAESQAFAKRLREEAVKPQ